MKRMKKLLAVLLAAIMVMSLGSVSVMADDNKTITITGATADRTYYAYQIFSGTYSDSKLTNIGVGSGLNVDSSDPDSIAAITKLLTSSTATVNITFDYDGETYTELGEFVTAYMDVYANESVAWIATLLSTYGDANPNMVLAFAEITAQFLTSKYATASYEDGVYTFSNLADGYYLIVEQNSTAASNSSYSRYMLVNAGESITAKSVTPTLDKQIVLADSSKTDTSTASIGDTVDYVLTSTVPDMTGYSSYTFEITDKISKGLTLTEASDTTNVSTAAQAEGLKKLDLAIAVGGSTISGMRVYDADDSSAASNYAYYYYTSTDTNGVTTLTIVFNNFISSGYTTGAAISVTYSAVLDEDAVIGSTGNENTAYLTYSNNPNLVSVGQGGYEPSEETGTTVEEEAVVYTYELDLTKVDSVSTSTTLSGAKFYLYKDVDGTTYYAVVEEDTAGTDGYYTVKEWTTKEADKSTLVSGTAGQVYIKGLGEGTYYLVETEAPTGYSVWISAMTIVIEAETDASSTTSLSATIGSTAATTETSSGKITASVTNSSSSTIPTTGGIGTTIFYIVGAILVVGASVILITRRRMGNRA